MIQDRIESLDQKAREMILAEVQGDEIDLEVLWHDYLIDMNGDDAIYVVVPGSGTGPIYLGTPGQVLLASDPVAYRCARNDFIDSCLKDGTVIDIEGRLFEPLAVEKALDELEGEE